MPPAGQLEQRLAEALAEQAAVGLGEERLGDLVAPSDPLEQLAGRTGASQMSTRLCTWLTLLAKKVAPPRNIVAPTPTSESRSVAT